jgi:hypothetical protein
MHLLSTVWCMPDDDARLCKHLSIVKVSTGLYLPVCFDCNGLVCAMRRLTSYPHGHPKPSLFKAIDSSHCRNGLLRASQFIRTTIAPLFSILFSEPKTGDAARRAMCTTEGRSHFCARARINFEISILVEMSFRLLPNSAPWLRTGKRLITDPPASLLLSIALHSGTDMHSGTDIIISILHNNIVIYN